MMMMIMLRLPLLAATTGDDETVVGLFRTLAADGDANDYDIVAVAAVVVVVIAVSNFGCW